MFRRTQAGRRVLRTGYIDFDRQALREALGLDPEVYEVLRRPGRGRRAEILREGTARVNAGAMWKLMADKLYGSSVDAPAVATREALQNSRDAIDKAMKAGLIGPNDGRFDVTRYDSDSSLEWQDNGIGMEPDVVFDKFLSLGDTTKLDGDSAGGFGVAKAIILGLSTTFRWELHSLGYLYRADGFDKPVTQERAPFRLQGTRLRIYDIAEKQQYRYSRWGDYALASRLRTVLSGNTLSPRRGHAGIRLYLDGQEVAPRHVGHGKLLAKDVEVDRKTKFTMRAFPGSREGMIYVRLDGLLQFRDSMYPSPPFDLVVDVKTRIAPTADAYPLNAARTELDGDTAYNVRRLQEEVLSDTQKALKDDGADTADLGASEGDEAEVLEGVRQALEAQQALLNDAAFKQRLKIADSGGETLRALLADMRRTELRYAALAQEARKKREARSPRRSDPDFAAESSWAATAAPSPPPSRTPRQPKKTSSGLSLSALRQLQEKPSKGPARGPRKNPWLGLAALHVTDTAKWPARRLRRYTSKPEAYYPVAVVWRMTIQLILDELERGDQSFDVGFLFSDDAIAMIKGARGDRPTIYINLDWFTRAVSKTHKQRPLALASILHQNACHEIAHMWYGPHRDDFVAKREQIADETAGLLYPIVAAVEAVLDVKPAPTPERKELERLRKEVQELREYAFAKTRRKGMANKARSGAYGRLVKLRRHLTRKH